MVERNKHEPVAEGKAEPVAYAVLSSHSGDVHEIDLFKKRESADRHVIGCGGVTTPLYTTPPSPSLRDVRADALALRSEALDIFDGPECPQSVRDAIEWYDSSLRVLLARLEGGG